MLERGTFRVVGVFEIYEQVEDLISQIRIAQGDAWRAIALSMSALYLILVGLVANASRTISRLQRLQELERYFSPAVARAIASREPGAGRTALGGSARANLSRRLLTRGEISVLFTDIRGFTRQSEQMDPADVVEMLNGYMDVVTTAVFKHNGSIDKFLGDGVLAVFGAPLPDPQHADDAVQAALNRARGVLGHPPIIIGAAVTSGPAVTGNIGSNRQLSFTVIGDTVNLGSRLVGLAQPGQVLISRRTFELAQQGRDGRPARRVRGPATVAVRGREEPATIYLLEPDEPETAGPPAPAAPVARSA